MTEDEQISALWGDSLNPNTYKRIVHMLTELEQKVKELGITPIGHTVVNLETSTEDYTAYDRGDLCVELDRAMGDLIERVLHRYMSKEEAQVERRNKIGDFADTIIQRDKAYGE